MTNTVELPMDVWNQILWYFPLEKQSSIRRVSKVISKAAIKFEECCVEPSSWEIINLLSIILKLYNTKLFQYIRLPGSDLSKIILVDKESETQKEIILTYLYMYGIWLGKHYELSNRHQLINFIGNFKLKLDDKFTFQYFEKYQPINWLVLRNLLCLRTNCTSRGWNSDMCYISFVSKYKSNTNFDLNPLNLYDIIIDSQLPMNKLHHILNSNALERLAQDLHTFYKLGKHKSGERQRISLDLNGLNELNDWLKHWLLTSVKPDDLIDNLLYTEIYNQNELLFPVYTYKTLLNPLQQLGYFIKDMYQEVKTL